MGEGEREYTQGILINEEKMPIHPLTAQICTVWRVPGLSLNPEEMAENRINKNIFLIRDYIHMAREQ